MDGVHAAIVTQFTEDLEVDHLKIGAQIGRLLAGGISGIVACGTMGEANNLTATERDEVLQTVISAVAGRVPVCAGITAISAELAGEHARRAAAMGADSVMCQPPQLYRADRRELLAFFEAVGAATDLPLMVYNNPEATGIDMPAEFLAEIVRRVPTVRSIKETSGDARRIPELIGLVEGVDVLVGGDDCALEGASTGAAGWISGVGVVLPGKCVELWELGVAGKLAQARAIYAELLPLARFDMTSKLVQYFKAALDELGLDGGPCRPPRLPLDDSELASLRVALAAAT